MLINCFNGIIFAAFFFSFILPTPSEDCPAKFLRFTTEHSYCKPRNESCPIFQEGVKPDEIKQILDVHNKYRSEVATGKEKKAGGLPEAADMLQMVWDEDLAAVAQRRAEHCIYEHDCTLCRSVENFSFVGQNIAYEELQCSGDKNCTTKSETNWPLILKLFYDEVDIFDKKYMDPFISHKDYGHFTQMIWAKTWKIGCGYVAYTKGRNGFRQFYVCNYGPGGNVVKSQMYKPGSPCSACPMNSCCGESCKGADYDGLCRMNKDDKAPIYKPEGNYIFYCDFRNFSGDCSQSVVGSHEWKIVNALDGSFVEVVLKGGENSTLKLETALKPKKSLCFVLSYRSGPTLAGQKSSNKVTLTCEKPGSKPDTLDLPNLASFSTFRYDTEWKTDTSVSFTFSVPDGSPEQFFDIRLVAAKDGEKC